MEERIHHRLVQGLPARLDDVLRHPDGRPRPLPVGGVDQHPRDGTGALAGVEDADPVVGQVHPGQGRKVRPDGLAQGGVEGVDRTVALGRGHHPMFADVHLDRRFGADRAQQLRTGTAPAPSGASPWPGPSGVRRGR